MKTIKYCFFFTTILISFSGCSSSQTKSDKNTSDSTQKPIDTIGLHQLLPPLPKENKIGEWDEYDLKGKLKADVETEYDVVEKDGRTEPGKPNGNWQSHKFDSKGMLTEYKRYCTFNSSKPCAMIKNTFDKNGFKIKSDGIDYVSGGSTTIDNFKNDEEGRPIHIEHYSNYMEGPVELKSLMDKTYDNKGQLISKISYLLKNGVKAISDSICYTYYPDGLKKAEVTYNDNTKICSDSTVYIYHSTGRLLEETTYSSNKEIIRRTRIQYNSKGIAEQLRKYEEKGILESILYYDDDGVKFVSKKTLDKNGKTKSVDHYPGPTEDIVKTTNDEKGNWIIDNYSHKEDVPGKGMVEKVYKIVKRTIEYY